MDLLPKLIFWESQMIPSYSFKFADEEKDATALCTSFAHLLHIFCMHIFAPPHSVAFPPHIPFSTAFPAASAADWLSGSRWQKRRRLLRSKSSSVGDWLEADGENAAAFCVANLRLCDQRPKDVFRRGSNSMVCGSLNPISRTTQNKFPAFPSSKTDPSWVFKIFQPQPQQWLVMMASQVRFLICTDVAARGIDIAGLPFVIQCLSFVVTKG